MRAASLGQTLKRAWGARLSCVYRRRGCALGQHDAMQRAHVVSNGDAQMQCGAEARNEWPAGSAAVVHTLARKLPQRMKSHCDVLVESTTSNSGKWQAPRLVCTQTVMCVYVCRALQQFGFAKVFVHLPPRRLQPLRQRRAGGNAAETDAAALSVIVTFETEKCHRCSVVVQCCAKLRRMP